VSRTPLWRLSSEFWVTYAQYASKCGRCDGDIREGDEIGRHVTYGWCCDCVKGAGA
jgi:hypothetical protein